MRLEDFVLHVPLMSAVMSDHFSTLLIFALIGSACWVVAALPHLSAYSAAVTWAVKLVG